MRLALGAGATFVARSIDVEAAHLQGILHRMARHEGAALVEIYQNCNVFNDGAFDGLTDKKSKSESQLRLEHGKPLVFAGGTKGVRLRGMTPEVVDVGPGGVPENELLVWDEKAPSALAFLMANLPAGFPTPIGIFRAEERPAHHVLEEEQRQRVTSERGEGDLARLLSSGDTWVVD